MEYDSFAKDFYDESPDVFAMDDGEVSCPSHANNLVG